MLKNYYSYSLKDRNVISLNVKLKSCLIWYLSMALVQQNYVVFEVNTHATSGWLTGRWLSYACARIYVCDWVCMRMLVMLVR